jgi:hypothetical protein
MQAQKLSDLQIKICIVPRRVRWPDEQSSPGWAAAQNCVRSFESLIRDVDNACLQVEQDKELSGPAVRHQRALTCDRALGKLIEFRPLQVAERALSEDINALERLSERNLKQSEMLRQLKVALSDLQEGIEATRRMVLDRCDMGKLRIRGLRGHRQL